MSTTVLITGANRGLGLGLLSRYLQLPNHTIIAANRNPTSSLLSSLPTAPGTKLIIIKLDAGIWEDASIAVKNLENQGIDHIDIVIANAGVCTSGITVAEVKKEEIVRHMDVNAYGVVSLYQAVRPLLRRGREPIFAVMGTIAGSLNTQPPFPNATYGPSKGAGAWYSIRINEEDSWLHSFSLCPGWVHTDLGDDGAVALGVPKAMQDQNMISVDESCDGMMKALAGTTKAKHGGKLVLWTGDVMPW